MVIRSRVDDATYARLVGRAKDQGRDLASLVADLLADAVSTYRADPRRVDTRHGSN